MASRVSQPAGCVPELLPACCIPRWIPAPRPHFHQNQVNGIGEDNCIAALVRLAKSLREEAELREKEDSPKVTQQVSRYPDLNLGFLGPTRGLFRAQIPTQRGHGE